MVMQVTLADIMSTIILRTAEGPLGPTPSHAPIITIPQSRLLVVIVYVINKQQQGAHSLK